MGKSGHDSGTKRALRASLRFRSRGAADAKFEAAANEEDAGGGGDGSGEDDDVKVMLRLSAKLRQLMPSESAIRTARDSAPSDDEYRARDLQLSETISERLYCDARFDAIDAGQPFNDPGPGAEEALVAAITAVDTALQNTAAVGALLGAVHSLVLAYPASATEPK